VFARKCQLLACIGQQPNPNIQKNSGRLGIEEVAVSLLSRVSTITAKHHNKKFLKKRNKKMGNICKGLVMQQNWHGTARYINPSCSDQIGQIFCML
jgi:hypothetical protein